MSDTLHNDQTIGIVAGPGRSPLKFDSNGIRLGLITENII